MPSLARKLAFAFRNDGGGGVLSRFLSGGSAIPAADGSLLGRVRDISIDPDLSEKFLLIGGFDLMAEVVLKRLTTDGLFYDLEYGIDIREFLNRPLDQAGSFEIQAAIEAELEKDERIISASAQVVFDEQEYTLTISLTVETSQGPFSLVLEASKLTVELLRRAA